MKLVCRNSLWERRHLYFCPISEFDIFYGEKLPTPSWAEPDSICITAVDTPSRMRIIERDRIVSIDDAAQAPVTKTSPTIKTVLVEGDKGKSYVVTVNGKIKTCTCLGFSFRKSCKHVLKVG